MREWPVIKKDSPSPDPRTAWANLCICTGGSWTSSEMHRCLFRHSKIRFPLEHDTMAGGVWGCVVLGGVGCCFGVFFGFLFVCL